MEIIKEVRLFDGYDNEIDISHWTEEELQEHLYEWADDTEFFLSSLIFLPGDMHTIHLHNIRKHENNETDVENDVVLRFYSYRDFMIFLTSYNPLFECVDVRKVLPSHCY